jgi:uncharacterized membrane protein/uncharacterized membrane protein YgcG
VNFRLDEPWWLALLALGVPVAWVGSRWLVSMSAARQWSAIVLRIALLAVLACLLAGAAMIRTTDRAAVVAVVDVSGSVTRFYRPPPGPDGKERTLLKAVGDYLAGAAEGRKSDDLSGVVLFDSTARATAPPGPGPFVLPERVEGSEEGTDLEGALRLARAMIPPDAKGRIVLFSDGVATSGDALRAAGAMGGPSAGGGGGGGGSGGGGRRIPVDVVPLNYAVRNEVMIESVDAPPTAPAGASVPVRVAIRATAPATGTLTLTHEGEPVDLNGGAPGTGLRLTLEAGVNVEVIPVALGPGRVHRFEAAWEPDPPAPGAAPSDTIAANNWGAAFTVAPGKGSVLLVDGVSGGDPAGPGATLAKALQGSGIDVRTVSPESVRPDLLDLQQYDLILLQNVAADALPSGTPEALATCATHLGIGVVMIGGPESFGPGGWKGSALEPLLPVLLDLPERLVAPAAAVILVIDNSGSMNRNVLGSGRSQQDVANEGAAQAIESLDKNDLVGVITFNSDYDVEIRLGPNADPKASAKRVRTISADGGTYCPPALREAHNQLRAVQAEAKHVIVLSDGVSQGREELEELCAGMLRDGIHVTTVAIGDDADVNTMARMAAAGAGRFYRVVDPNLLPRVLLKAVRIVRSPQIRQVPFTPVVLPSGSPVLEGVTGAGGEIPALGGLVLTQARSSPTVINVLATPDGEPVLSYWNAGLGRVAAFTSDAHAEWAKRWLGWPGYARLWSQLARTVARPPTDRTQTVSAEVRGDRLTVRLEAQSDAGRPLDLLDVPGTVYGPAGPRDVKLAQIGPGQYEAVVPAAAGGTYVVTLAPRQNGRLLSPVIAGVARPGGAEYRRLASDEGMLRRVAELTGGRVLDLARPGGVDLFRRDDLVPAVARTPLWWYLAVGAVAVLLLDVATRRVAWDRLISREFGAEVRREAMAALRDRTEQARGAMSRLKTHEERVERSMAAGPSGESPAPLGDEAAEAIIREQAERRRKAREAARKAAAEAAQGAPAGTTPEAKGAPIVRAPAEDVAAGPSSLLEAKRRAKRRMEDADGGGVTGGGGAPG